MITYDISEEKIMLSVILFFLAIISEEEDGEVELALPWAPARGAAGVPARERAEDPVAPGLATYVGRET